DCAWRLRPHHLDHDVELEFQVRDLGLQHRGVVVGIDLVEFLHPLDAGGKEAGIANLRVDRLGRRADHDLAGELHGCAAADGGPRRLVFWPVVRSRWCTRTPEERPRGEGGASGAAAAPGILAHRRGGVKKQAKKADGGAGGPRSSIILPYNFYRVPGTSSAWSAFMSA